MKYIIEIPDDVQYVLLNGKADNKYYTAVRPIAELEELNSDYINEHFGELQDEAYKRGYEDGKWKAEDGCDGCKYYEDTSLTNPCSECSRGHVDRYEPLSDPDRIEVGDEAYQKGINDGSLDVKQRVEGAYQRGLEDAWEAAKKIALMDTETSENVTGYFGLFRIMENLTPMQAIAKLKAYKDKQKEDDSIKVGDEVTHKSDFAVWTAVCIRIDGDGRHMNLMGHTGAVGYYPVDDFKKTGRHFNIGEILEAMRTHD